MNAMEQNSSQDLLPFVPSLTRHARALAGSEQVAAERVRLCLELLAAQPERMRGDDTRAELFRAFHDLWSPETSDAVEQTVIPFNQHAGRELPGWEDAFERCVLQLVYVERFSQGCVADILSVDERRIAEILLKRQRGSQLPVNASVLIIEDDALMAKHLNEIIQELGLTVINVADGVETAVCAAFDHRPAVILIDIHLRKGESGLTAARAILQRRRVPIIFVTGYPWMLELQGELDSVFVVAKPFRPRALKAKIAQALETYSEAERAEACHAHLLAKFRELLGGHVGGREHSRH
ncbi:MAG: response regulator [Alphaproteobacteria bacterium]